MSLPNLPYEDTLRREVRTEWGGLNLNENAGDGELIEAMNMSSREYPLLATAPKPVIVAHVNAHTGLYSPVLYDKLYWTEFDDITAPNRHQYFTYADANPAHAESREISDTLSNELRYGAMNKMICMMPNKQYYDVDTDTVKDMEAKVQLSGALFESDDLAEYDEIYKHDANWAQYFKVGDAVTISGSAFGNNKTAIVRDITGDRLQFYSGTFTPGRSHECTTALPAGTYKIHGTEKCFVMESALPGSGVLFLPDGWESIVFVYYVDGEATYLGFPLEEGLTPDETIPLEVPGYLEQAQITVKREVPDMDFLCVNENRLWGCHGDTIYASKLGDPLNFNVFDGLSTDSWAVETGTPGDFTGCASFQGYPVFFKKNAVFRVYGDTPQNFTLRKQNIAGVAPGCDLSLAEIRGCLYYMSTNGIMAWNGGDYPSVVSSPLGIDFQKSLDVDYPYYDKRDKWSTGRAGTDGDRYYLSIAEWGAAMRHLFSYDTRFGVWHELTPTSYTTAFASDGGECYLATSLTGGYELLRLPGNLGFTDSQPWTATFADSTRAYKTVLTGSEGKKGILRLLIRCKVTGSMTVWIAYDGGDFEDVKTIGGEDGAPKDTYIVPLILRRCDRWQLRLTGTQTAVIYSIAVERYVGEWQQAE